MSDPPRKEWFGESGYCNCLLVAMSRMALARLEIRSDQRPSDLDELTSSRPATAEWIRAQQFDYRSLDARQVILTLAGMAGIYRAFWKPKTGLLKVHDVVEDDGPVVERVFDMELKKERRVWCLEVALRAELPPED